MDRSDLADGPRPAAQDAPLSPAARLAILFTVLWLLSLLCGAAASGLLHLSENETVRGVLHDSLSPAAGKSLPDSLLGFLSLCLPDIRFLLLLFALGFCVFSAQGAAVLLLFRGVVTGLALGIGVSAGFFTQNPLSTVLLTCGAQAASAAALLVTALAAVFFAQGLRRAGGRVSRMFSAPLLGRFCFRFCLALGLAALSGSLRMLACHL